MEKLSLQKFWSIAKPENLKLYKFHEWMNKKNSDVTKHRTVQEWKNLVSLFIYEDTTFEDFEREETFEIKLNIG